MGTDEKKDLMVGMMFSLLAQYKDKFTQEQLDIYSIITDTINKIYYPEGA